MGYEVEFGQVLDPCFQLTGLLSQGGTASSAAPIMIGLIAASLLLANLAAFVLIVAYEYPHSLASDSADAWENPLYLRSLPNVLRLLSVQGFQSVWPSRCNPWAERSFERALLKAVNPMVGTQSRAFVQRHLSLWRWVVSHRADLRQSVRRRFERSVRERLAATTNPSDHAPLLAFLNGAYSADMQNFPDFRTRLRLRNLDRVQIILREHGYSVTPEFREMDLMGQISDEEFAEWFIHAGKLYRTLLKNSRKSDHHVFPISL